MLDQPARFLLVPFAMAAGWYWNRRRVRDAREAGELQEGLTFDNIHTPEVERLNL
jgi:lipopolysaccharide biosynthesis regulator YciM